jgi:CAAX protease family protein
MQAWLNEARPVSRPGRGWQVLQFPLTRIVVAAAVIVGVIVSVQVLGHALGAAPSNALGSVLGLGLVALTSAAYVGYVRVVERRRVVELAPQGAVGDVVRGVALGAALFGTTILVLCVVGAAAIGRGAGWTALITGLITALTAAVTEEILLRGVLFRIAEERLGTWIALGLSALMFGLLHAANPGASLVSTLAIALEAGILLAAAYAYSRRLWLPIGLHLGWNFTESGIFGAVVSGNTLPGMWSSRFTGPELLTGGAFGPEASVVAVAVCLIAAAVVILAARRRGTLVRPWWSPTVAPGIPVAPASPG